MPRRRDQPIVRGDDIRHLLDLAGVTQQLAADMCLVNLRTMQRWIAGDSPMPYLTWEILKQKLGAEKAGV
jgi:hypothetical protein